MGVAEDVKQTVTFDDVIAAAQRIRSQAHDTPVLSSRLFNEASGVQAFFKCENLQRGGAFKFRGALNFMLQLSEEERARGVVTYSSGNHAQAVAIAAAHLGVKATIVMPEDAPRSKRESTEAYRPKIVFYNRQTENREEIAGRIARETGAITLPPYDHPWVIAGQATVAYELLRECPDLDAIALPAGGGGLFAGTLVVAKAVRPGIRVFGVEPELADDWYQSLQKGERVEISAPPTIADGLRTVAPGCVTFPIVKALADGVLLVSEEEICAAVRFLLSRVKILTEPSGAVGAAAVLHGKLPREVRSVGIILSGGNVDMQVLAAICSGAV
jgi:threonine dehydratase